MPKDTSNSLGDHPETFAEKLDALRAALVQGEGSGPSMPFDFDAFLAGKRAQRPGRRITA